MIIPKYDEPMIAGIICFERSVYAGSGGACGSSERARDVIIYIDECVRVRPDNSCIYGGVGRRDVAKDEIGMPMEESA